MSGYTPGSLIHEGCLDAGTRLLEKPFTPDGLRRRVLEVLDARAWPPRSAGPRHLVRPGSRMSDCAERLLGGTLDHAVVEAFPTGEDPMDDQERRDAAIKRIKDRREFKTHITVYVVVNLFLVGIWAMTSRGYFWPGWVIAGWGIGLVLHGWQVYRGDKPITDAEIQREMDRLG